MISRIRRRLLAGALLVLVDALPFSRALKAAPRQISEPRNVPFGDLHTGTCLGQHYLELYPEERSARLIAHELFGDECASVCNLNNRPDMQKRVLQQHEQDFRQGDVVIIAGWVLTRTEARVFALSAIESTS